MGNVTLSLNDRLLQRAAEAFATSRPETFQVYSKHAQIRFNNPPVESMSLPDSTQIDFAFDGIAGGPPSVTFTPNGARISVRFSLSLFFSTNPPQTFTWAATLRAVATWVGFAQGFALQLQSTTFDPPLPDPWNGIFGIVLPAFINPGLRSSLVVPPTIATSLPGVSYATQQVLFSDSALTIVASI